jgi:transposase
MDNASFHKRKDILEAIADKGCILEFLPVYSPDLNPIEHFWAMCKSMRRKFNCSVFSLFSSRLKYDSI